ALGSLLVAEFLQECFIDLRPGAGLGVVGALGFPSQGNVGCGDLTGQLDAIVVTLLVMGRVVPFLNGDFELEQSVFATGEPAALRRQTNGLAVPLQVPRQLEFVDKGHRDYIPQSCGMLSLAFKAWSRRRPAAILNP